MRIVQVNRQYRLEGKWWRIERYPDGSVFLSLSIEIGDGKQAVKLYENFIIPEEGEKIIERFEASIKRVSGIGIQEVIDEHTGNRTASDNRNSDS